MKRVEVRDYGGEGAKGLEDEGFLNKTPFLSYVWTLTPHLFL
jgi:hypothetical protein